jgi:hypothetical protein
MKIILTKIQIKNLWDLLKLLKIPELWSPILLPENYEQKKQLQIKVQTSLNYPKSIILYLLPPK